MEGSARDLLEYRKETAGKRTKLALVLLSLLALTAVWRITQGEWAIPLARVAELISPFLSGEDLSSPEALVVRSVRLPRFLAAAGTGGLLAVSGVVLQGLLANPLAEPYTLGIASGAAFGGALGFFFGSFAVTPAAFAGALFALWLVGVIAWRSGGGGAYIVLAGIITNAVLSAGVTFLKAIADDKLGAIVLWLMGSLSGASPASALMAWAGAAFVFVPAFVYGRQLDAVSLGEGRGELLGVDERKLRRTLLFFASIATALAVSCFGIIGCRPRRAAPAAHAHRPGEPPAARIQLPRRRSAALGGRRPRAEDGRASRRRDNGAHRRAVLLLDTRWKEARGVSGAFVLDSVSCGYGGKDILSGFSASVKRGALTALIGPNGSGKSTLLKLLGGVVGYRGSAELEGRELRSMSRAEFGRAVGFVPQQTKISSPFTVYEVIAMGRLPYCGLFSKLNAGDDAAVLDAAGRAGVSHLLFRRASELSGGEQQRVYIAVALAQDPDIFLLDEPTSALDPSQSVRIFSILRELAARGKTVVVAAHDLNAAIPFSDRYIALRGGALASQGAASELDEKVLGPLYGIEFKKYTSEEGGRAWHPSAQSF